LVSLSLIRGNTSGQPRESNGERMAKKDGSESLKQRVPLLVHRRKVAADTGIGGGSIFAAEGASHLSRELWPSEDLVQPDCW
jgi:hypothetical protein